MPNIILASALSRYANNRKEFQFEGRTLHDILSAFCRKNREISKYIFKAPDALHPFINIYVDNKNVRDLKGLETEISTDSVIRILPGISGG